MITPRPAQSRGTAQRDWLKSAFTFSFADYYDPQHLGFSCLRVINEDWIQPSTGFPTHGHQNMEIITYLLTGTLEHQDSLGSRSLMNPGDVQRMSAGTGVRHSEYNASADSPLHLLQIWLLPDRQNHLPSYEQRFFSAEQKRGKLCLLVSPDGAEGSLSIHQDARLYGTILASGETVTYDFSRRQGWLQVVRGKVHLGDRLYASGDGAAISQEALLSFQAQEENTEFLLFDLP